MLLVLNPTCYIYLISLEFTTRKLAFSRGSNTGATTPGKKTRGRARKCSWQIAKAYGGNDFHLPGVSPSQNLNFQFPWHGS